MPKTLKMVFTDFLLGAWTQEKCEFTQDLIKRSWHLALLASQLQPQHVALVRHNINILHRIGCQQAEWGFTIKAD